jgi:LysM repeat protein
MAQRVPDYNEIGGDPSGYKDGHPYKIAVQPDSKGNPGVWHVYQDRSRDVFIAGGMSAPPAAPAAPIPAPPAAPANPTGGSQQAPDTAAAPAATATAAPAESVPTISAAGSHKQVGYVEITSSSITGKSSFEDIKKALGGALPPDTNKTHGSVHYDKSYYTVSGTLDSDGNKGTWHIYSDNTREFVPSPKTEIAQPLDMDFPDSRSVVASTSSSPGTPNADGQHDSAPSFSGQSAAATPAPAPDAPVVPGGSTYVVVPGDTLSAIAAAHSVELSQLEALNPDITDPNLILPGQQINLGDASTSSIQVATAAPASVAPGVDPSFPTTSSYDANAAEAGRAAAEKVPGWVGTAADTVKDPVDQVIQAAAASSQAQTDPLKIDDNKQ